VRVLPEVTADNIRHSSCWSADSSPYSSSSSALQPWVGIGLLKQMSPTTSILGIRPPISTYQFLCVFLHPVNPSWFRSAALITATQLHAVLWNPTVHRRVHNGSTLDPILHYTTPVHTAISHYTTIHLQLGLPINVYPARSSDNQHVSAIYGSLRLTAVITKSCQVVDRSHACCQFRLLCDQPTFRQVYDRKHLKTGVHKPSKHLGGTYSYWTLEEWRAASPILLTHKY
jgi:hypothetical protein